MFCRLCLLILFLEITSEAYEKCMRKLVLFLDLTVKKWQRLWIQFMSMYIVYIVFATTLSDGRACVCAWDDLHMNVLKKKKIYTHIRPTILFGRFSTEMKAKKMIFFPSLMLWCDLFHD